MNRLFITIQGRTGKSHLLNRLAELGYQVSDVNHEVKTPTGTIGMATLAWDEPTTPTATPPPAPKAKFKPGDVVTLNSGSPDMTVVDETNGEVRVIYFPETDTAAYASESQHACFPAVCLSAIPNDEAMN
jgi:uncharacterized protein YodC (DUF2158 family)